MNSLTIRSIDINGIGPVKSLHVDFDPHFNIICGANGVGKTTILDCVAQTFALQRLRVRCNSNMDKGSWKTSFDYNGKQDETDRSTEIKYLHSEFSGDRYYDQADSILVFKVNRLMPYVEIKSIDRDPVLEKWHQDALVADGVKYEQVKSWLVHRFVWSVHAHALNEIERENLLKAKECFKQLDSGFEFKEVSPETHDVIVKTPLGEIELEQLSSGYIAMIVVLLGIIKEVEYRFKDPQTKKPLVKVQDFTGVIILDELDVHLHPTMQAQMYLALKKLLPNAQVITSTHSPHVIQVAKPSEIIPLVRKDGEVCINPLVNREYGCQGWTVEEILADVMNLQETRTQVYLDQIKLFKEGLDQDNIEKVKSAYQKLDKMLHKDSYMREVLKIQMIGVGDGQNQEN